jgi:hypothetical protein
LATDDTTDKTCTSKKYEFLKYLDEKISKNLFFFTANVQFPTNIRIKEDFYIDGDTIKFYEIVSGSLSAIPLSIEN